MGILRLILIYCFIFNSSIFHNSGRAAAGPVDFIKTQYKALDYSIESAESYDYRACKDFQKEDDFDYYITCVDENIAVQENFDNLLKDVKAVELEIAEDVFLKQLQSKIKKDLEMNLAELDLLKKCLSKEANNNFLDNSENCKLKRNGVKLSVRKELPKMRNLMAQMNMAGHLYGPTKPERFQRDNLVHEISGQEVAPLTEREIRYLKGDGEKIGHIEKLENSFRDEVISANHPANDQEVNRFHKIDGLENCIDTSLVSAMMIRPSSECERFHVQVGYRVNNSFDRQNKIYKGEYQKLLAGNPMLSLLSVSGEESDDEVLADINGVISKLRKSGEEALKEVNSLKGEDRVNLLRFNEGVEGLLEGNNQNSVYCDVAQKLINEADFDELKTDLFIGAAALIGGGVCGFTLGLGCAIGFGIALGAEATAIGVSQARHTKAQRSFYSGLVDAQTTMDREFERDLSLYLAPLAFVGGQQAVAAFRVGRQVTDEAVETTGEVGRRIETDTERGGKEKRKGPRRYDLAQRKAINDLSKSLGYRRDMFLKNYNPGNRYELSPGDQVYFAGIAEITEKEVLKEFPKLRNNPVALRAKVQGKLDDLIKDCAGEKK